MTDDDKPPFSRVGEGEAAQWIAEQAGEDVLVGVSALAAHTAMRYPLQSFRRTIEEHRQRRKEAQTMDTNNAPQPDVHCPMCEQSRPAPPEARTTTFTLARILCGFCWSEWHDGTLGDREGLFVRALTRLGEASKQRASATTLSAAQAKLLTEAGAASARDTITMRLQAKLAELTTDPGAPPPAAALEILLHEVIAIAGENPLEHPTPSRP